MYSYSRPTSKYRDKLSANAKKNTTSRKKNKKKRIKNVGRSHRNPLRLKTPTNKNKKKNTKTGKLDKNIIDVPLSKDIMLGTVETLGNMGYYYQKYSNIFEFFNYIINHYNVTGEYKLEGLCMPSFGNIHTGTFAALQFNLDNEYSVNNPRPSEQYVPLSDTITIINECLVTNDRFVVLSYQIISLQYEISHANTIIFDKKLKIVELFEPHGSLTESTTMNGMVGAYKRIDDNLEKFLSVNFPAYKYRPPHDYLPSYGLQVKIDTYNGLCVTWNILYIHYKLMNPDVPSKNLISHINKFINLDKILRYAKYVKYNLKLSNEFKLKSHPHQ